MTYIFSFYILLIIYISVSAVFYILHNKNYKFVKNILNLYDDIVLKKRHLSAVELNYLQQLEHKSCLGYINYINSKPFVDPIYEDISCLISSTFYYHQNKKFLIDLSAFLKCKRNKSFLWGLDVTEKICKKCFKTNNKNSITLISFFCGIILEIFTSIIVEWIMNIFTN